MSLVDWMGRHGRSVVFVALALAAAGLVAALSMPIGLFPQVSFPRVVVDLNSGSRPADQMALVVTRPVEEILRTVPGVQDVRSTTSRGSAQISIDFGWGRDMIASTLLVDAAVSQVLPSLPPGSGYGVRRMDPTVFPIISYALLSDTQTPVQLRDLAQYQILPLLSSVSGLSRVAVQGGEVAEIQVETDPQRLAARGLGFADLTTAVANANVLQSVGRVQDHDKLYLVVSDRSLHTGAEIGDIIVRADRNGMVRLRDVATVRDGVVPQWLRITEDGKPAVLFNVYQQPDGNSVQIARDVQAKLAAFALPQGVTLRNWYDQSELVLQSAASVRDAVLIGLVLAAIVLLAFLRSWRATLIAVLVVPLILASTMLLLQLMGLGFNIMTLGGIAAAVGLVIDDVIVMLEHIARRAGAPDAGDAEARRALVLPAAREFLLPLTGSSLATLIVFLPLGFLSGVTGAFSKALSVTMAAALIISYLMTALLTPVMARRMIDFGKWQDHGAGSNGWLARGHGAGLAALFRRPWLLAVVALPLLGLGYVSYGHVPTGFMPAVDEGGFVMDYFSTPGTSLAETDREIAQVEALLSAIPEVDTYSRRLGTGLGGDLGQTYHGDFFVRLKPGHARSTDAVMSYVLAEVDRQVPGIHVELAQLMEDLIGDLTAVPQPIEIKLYAADASGLNTQADRVAAAISALPGIIEVRSGVRLAGDAMNIVVNAERAAQEGSDPAQVTAQVDAALNGTVATQLPQATQLRGVRVWLSGALELREAELNTLPIRAPDGHVFPLGRVASVTPILGQPQITRDNLQPMVSVTGRIGSQGIGAAIAAVQQELAKPGLLDAGTRYELGGLYQQQQIAFAGLTRVFAAALVAEFVLLLFLYERFWLPVIVIGCSLFSTTAVFSGLWLAGVDLNITALMGTTMIIGIGTEMAIFYVSEYTELSHAMPPREALMQASRNRLRPITMTTLAAILTLLPLAFAIGQGSEIQQPLAIAIVSGLILQYPLVLLALPVLIGLTLGRQAAPLSATAAAS